MKPKLKSLPLVLAAGTLAVAITGCGSMDHRHSARSDRMEPVASGTTVDRTVTTERTVTVYPNSGVVTTSSGAVVSRSTPASVDPFSPGYVSFPAMANESAGVIGHSAYCVQHYNQPGCQSADTGYGPSRDRRFYRDSTGSLDDRRY